MTVSELGKQETRFESDDRQDNKIIEESVSELRTEQKANDLRNTKSITNMAHAMERIYLRHGNHWAISTISQQISQRLAAEGLRCAAWVSDYLPQRYKNENRVTGGQLANPADVNKTIENITSSVGEDLGKRIEHFSTQRQTWKDLPRDNMQKLPDQLQILEKQIETARDSVHRLKIDTKAICINRQIAVTPEPGLTKLDMINAEKDAQRIPKTIRKTDPREGPLYLALIEYSKGIKDIADNLKNYPLPEQMTDVENKLASVFVDAKEYLKPYIDLKFREDSYSWLNIEIDRINHGKHAAAVKNHTITYFCKRCDVEMKLAGFDPSGWSCQRCGEKNEYSGWVCPECKGTVSQKRNLTREQVGDKEEENILMAKRIIEFEPIFIAFHMLHKHGPKPRVAQRNNDLGPDLSDKA